MDLVPIKDVLDVAIETRRALPEAAGVFKQLLETYVSDPLKDRRERRRVDRVAKLADQKIGDRKKEENIEEVMTSTEVDPLLQAIRDDDRKELQEIWANMLAKFATGNMKGFRRDYISTLRKMEPIDIICLDSILSIKMDLGFVNTRNIADIISRDKNIDKDDVLISIDNLIELKCLTEPGDHFTLIQMQAPYGRKLYEACQPIK
ncbi:Abi-alpha family protein [Gluconobacter wancherniae]|uniref:Abi-alpha family protein n=1 Tax=Gluconobacter wancherniae TaxID=1307955 RepID=UPI001B8D96EC|nr:hypothetical protein [Gluconobacter wancherniae]MBS1089094.1 hypothetical protein [Gluconobacter wancherniae]